MVHVNIYRKCQLSEKIKLNVFIVLELNMACEIALGEGKKMYSNGAFSNNNTCIYVVYIWSYNSVTFWKEADKKNR